MLASLLLLALPAQALELRFWGVGPTLGTMVMPGKYPLALPDAAQTEVNGKDVDKVQRVQGDLEIGAKGVLYPGPGGRLTGRLAHTFGTNGFSRNEITFGYDKVIYREGKDFQFLVGGATGYGSENFPQREDGPGRLDLGYYPLRANADALLRLGKYAAEVGLDGTVHMVSNGGWYTSKTDEEPDEKKLLDVASYFALGAHATFYFGDFTAPGSGGEKKKKKRGGKRDD